MKYADLHIHTDFSDSTLSPGEVASLAERCGLSAIAVCDHDSVDGIEPCLKSAEPLGLEVVPGIELTIEKEDAEIHILGYFIDWKSPSLLTRLAEMRETRIERIHRMIEKLKTVGIDVKAEDVFRLAGRGTVGRLHLARAMLNTGKVRSFKEIFNKYIGFAKPCYVSNARFSPPEAIMFILESGGVPVIAHPGIMRNDAHIPELVSYGLKGIEVYHTEHSSADIKRYEAMAEQYGLVMTGGSDCHGMGKGRVLIGTVRVPYELVEKLKDVSGKRRDDGQDR